MIGRFVSADSVQGNTSGMDPYDYVGGNPETRTDPTGHHWATIGEGGDSVVHNEPFDPRPPASPQMCTPGVDYGCSGPYIPQYGKSPNAQASGGNDTTPYQKQIKAQQQAYQHDADVLFGISDIKRDIQTLNSHANILHKSVAEIDLAQNIATDVGLIDGIGEGIRLAEVGSDALCSANLSFTSTTLVTTNSGKQAIGELKPGQKVLSYNPQTKKMELQPILHVWINHDNDLEDLTLVSTSLAKNGKSAQQNYETIHTNKKHPFLTQEYGFLPVANLHVGMHIVKADGSVGTIVAWTLVSGVSVMYNLEVQQDHTFTVGDGQWVVHNSSQCTDTLQNDIYRNIFGDADGVDLTVDQKETKNDRVLKGTISHFEDPEMLPGTTGYGILEAGTKAPAGTVWESKYSERRGNTHVGLTPIDPTMSVQNFQAAVNTLLDKYVVVQVGKKG